MRFILSFREAANGGAVKSGTLTRVDQQSSDPEADLATAARIVFLIHGYNVDEAEGREKLLALANSLQQLQNTALVAVLWPGDHWLGGLSYPFEWRDARDTSIELVRFVRNVPRRIPLSFATHSLGARVAMDALNTIWQLGYDIEQICLMAPAVDDDSLSDFRVYRAATERAQRVAVLSSVNDKVLRFTYPAGDLLYTLFYENEQLDCALGYRGPTEEPDHDQPVPGNVYHTPTPQSRGVGHADYLPPASDPNDKQLSATRYCESVLVGDASPTYA